MMIREVNVPLLNLHKKLFWKSTRQVYVLRMKAFIFSWVHECSF